MVFSESVPCIVKLLCVMEPRNKIKSEVVKEAVSELVRELDYLSFSPSLRGRDVEMAEAICLSLPELFGFLSFETALFHASLVPALIRYTLRHPCLRIQFLGLRALYSAFTHTGATLSNHKGKLFEMVCKLIIQLSTNRSWSKSFPALVNRVTSQPLPLMKKDVTVDGSMLQTILSGSDEKACVEELVRLCFWFSVDVSSACDDTRALFDESVSIPAVDGFLDAVREGRKKKETELKP